MTGGFAGLPRGIGPLGAALLADPDGAPREAREPRRGEPAGLEVLGRVAIVLDATARGAPVAPRRAAGRDSRA